MEYLYLQDGFYDSEDPKEIQRFLDSVEKGKVERNKDTGVFIVELSPIIDDLPC